MDPRVKTSTQGLQLQHDLSYKCYKDREQIIVFTGEIRAALARMEAIKQNNAIAQGLINNANDLLNGKESFAAVNNNLAGAFGTMQGADVAPTSQCIAAANGAHAKFEALRERWTKLKPEIDRIIRK